MKKFLAVYTGNPAAMAQWRLKDEEARARQSALGIAAWHKWVTDHQSSIVELGAPVGKTKRIATTGISDVTNNIGAYTVVQAENHQAAAELFINHPHFTIFPGDSVEIMECLPVPGV
jgi:hemolysin-activating ACP:hemolysin acyltransferase